MNVYWIFYYKPLRHGGVGYTNDLVEAYSVSELLDYYEDILGYEIVKIYRWN